MAGHDKEVYKKNVRRYESHASLVSDLRRIAYDMYCVPHVLIQGEEGKTGLVIFDQDTQQLLGAVWHPKYTQGTPGLEHVEAFRGRVIGWNNAVCLASEIVTEVQSSGFGRVAATSKAFYVGFENEVHMYDKYTGLPYVLPALHQQELQASLHETDVGFAVTLPKQALLLAQDVVDRSKKFPGAFATMTGMMLGARPSDILLNNGKYSNYVQAMSDRLFPYFCPRKDEDPLCFYVWNSFAQSHGFPSFEAMKNHYGHIGIMTFAASHIHCSLPHFWAGSQWYVPLELSTAVGLMMNSQMSLVAKWMMYSGGLAHGVQIQRIHSHGGVESARSARDVMRRALRTTDPASSPKTVEGYLDVAVTALQDGTADRIARAGMIAQDAQGERYAVPHGHLRHRIEAGNFAQPICSPSGRMEFVSGDATDIVAKLSAAAFLQLLQLGAYEAVSHSAHPYEYWRAFPALVHDTDQVALSDAYNFCGTRDTLVCDIISNAFDFVTYMESRYPSWDVQQACMMARYGLNYLRTDEGNLTWQLVHEYCHSDDVISRVHEGQLVQARRILELNGDVLGMVSGRI